MAEVRNEFHTKMAEASEVSFTHQNLLDSNKQELESTRQLLRQADAKLVQN